MGAAAQELEPVGVREVKNRFSELASRVVATGRPLSVLKNGKPWVTIQPADDTASLREERLARFCMLTQSIERAIYDEPEWDSALSDDEILNEERVRRFG